MKQRDIPGVGPYGGPAGGWGALQAVARAIRGQMAVKNDSRLLLRVNQPDGFDCPGCAWPDPLQGSSFEFCENGAKAVAWESTSRRVTPEFFARHSLAHLWEWEDHLLEAAGRLTAPMVYDAASDHYVPIGWDDAFATIGRVLSALPDPNMAEFYTSGRTSNEAAFLYQLFVREFGTNNFPDCSNLCHEATSVGLPASIGVGKATVTLEDFDHCDAIFCIGHNPGTNHPRMLATLREASRRGAPIVVFNPLRERGLERFLSPQDPVDMTLGRATRIASHYYQLKVGGDAALLQGMIKALLATDAERGNVLDHAFIAEHTTGFEDLKADLDATSWTNIESISGLMRAEIEEAAALYAAAPRVILCYGMGITQHCHGTSNVQQLANLLLLRGNIGREGAGICPLRGHSNVQGDRTVGITEIPAPAFLDSLERVFGFTPPRAHGHGAVAAIEAMRDGRSTALICLGGNLPVAMADPAVSFEALRGLELSVHIATKLNRSHLLRAQNLLLLPCLGRTERDVQRGGEQAVTVEDSVSKVHVSRGTLAPASDLLRSECAIVAGIARATLPDSVVDWDALVADYDRIRDAIAAVFPDFHDFNARVRQRGGFHLVNAARERRWNTPSGRATFLPKDATTVDPLADAAAGTLLLATIRSHDQYNTTIYGKDDRYRGISGRRDILFINAADLASRGLQHGDMVEVEAVTRGGPPPPVREHNAATGLESDAEPDAENRSPDGAENGQCGGMPSRRLQGLVAVAFDIPVGSVAAYYPEANCLVALAHHDRKSGTPSYKSIPVQVRAMPH